MAICSEVNLSAPISIDKKSKISAQHQYKITPFNKSFLFSLLSITWPAYKASETAGITSANPMSPIAKGALVNS